MLAAMLRLRPLLVLLGSLLGSALPTRAAHAVGVPCQPCAGLRLENQPAAAGPQAGETAAPDGLLRLLRAERLAPGSPLFIAWEVPLGTPPALPSGATGGAGDQGPGAAAAGAAAQAIAAAGATPWLTLVFSTPPPLAGNLARLQAELATAAEIAAAAPRGTWFQVAWRPAPAAAPAGGTAAGNGSGAGAPAASGAATAGTPGAEYAFLLKRAAVALGGAQAGMHVATGPLAPDPALLADLYGAEVAAYVDLVALAPDSGGSAAPGEAGAGGAAASGGAEIPAAPGAAPGTDRLAQAIAKVHELDPGRPIALDALPYPAAPAGAALAVAAREATAGIDLTLFRAPAGAPVNAAALNPLALLAREFAGDLSYDPGSAPRGAAESWVFVRGKDLALRVIAVLPAAAASGAVATPGSAATPGAPTPGAPTPGAAAEAVLHFPDPGLRRPIRFPFTAGQVAPPSATLTPAPDAGLEVRIPDPGPVVVLGVERLTAAERHGVAEKLQVASQHEMQVEEILKRLQVFEDAQNRRLEDYTAVNTTHLRFQPNAGANSIQASLAGPFFWSREGGADWAWESLYVNGVRWRGKTLPEIPLIQPEKAAALPLEIHFTRDYRYRLRGTATIGGRDAWVVDFAPEGPGAAGRRLYQGTVWIDRTLYARLRTRAVQIGLQGEVISNEETLDYRPVDALGQTAPWSAESFVLPLHMLAEQILSVLANPVRVERETTLDRVQINPPDFQARKQTVEATDVTMVRDTDQGLRYLVKKGEGPRVVKEGFAKSKLFALGGLFVDDALDYPLPLAGVNYFTFDFKNSGKQLNVFFAGALLVASASEPRLGGSDFDAGTDLFAVALPFTDNLYVGGHEVVDQQIKVRPATFSLRAGHPLGNFVKISAEYGLLYSAYSRNSKTAGDFVLPSDNLLQSVGGRLTVTRGGYTLSGQYSYNMRSSWRSWGQPGNPDFNPADRHFTRYSLTASKDWYLPAFQKIGTELDYFSGSHLDRFSKYQFGFFGGTRIHGYRSNAVRAQQAYVGHLSYGFDFGSAFRLDALFDAALATDKLDNLHHTLLAGTGVAGSLMGPWQTLVTLDVGVPVAGPDHGFVLYLVFLKLFH
jgi:hypothetical protein